MCCILRLRRHLTIAHLICRGGAIAFTGTADPWVESTDAITDRCQKAGIPVHVIEEANHSLETADVWKNLKNLEDIMKLTAEFIK